MEEIRLGLEAKLTEEQIAIYSNGKFTSTQMRQIRLGFEDPNLTDEQVISYADASKSANEMKKIRLNTIKVNENKKIKSQILDILKD